MRLPYSWLRDVVQAGAPGWDVPPDELEQTLIRIGHEVEEIIPVGPVTGPLTVGRVVEIEELTEFKKPIRAVKVDVGERRSTRDIVCGATNFAVGDLVVVALPGTVLPGDFTIATRKTYGRTSDGMICSTAELNLGTDHSGILVLPPGTAEPGDAGRRRARARRRGVPPGDHPRPRLLPVGARHGPRNRLRLRPRLRRPRRRSAAARRRRGPAGDHPARHRRDPVRPAAGHRHRPDSGVAVVDAAAAAAQRHPRDLARRRRHELRDARARSPDARPRPQPDHRRLQGSLRRAGGDGRHARRHRAQARPP